MTLLLHDIRSGLRTFRRMPGFTAAALLTLAVGIGATTTMFSFVNAIVLRPLPYPESDRLVTLSTARPGDFLDWQAQSQSFEHMAAFRYASVSVTGGGAPERLRGAFTTSHLFETLGVPLAVGRTPAAFGGRPEAAQTVVISAALWTRRFEEDPAIVGMAITLDNRPFIVAGVAPTGFTFPRDLPLGVIRDPTPVDVWLPLALQRGDGNYFLEVIARLKPQVTLAQARAEMDTIAARLAGQIPQNGDRGAVIITSLQERIVGDVTPMLLLLIGAGAFVLLIACANVANLMLARGAERQREVAIRSALGSGRWRIVRQFMVESLLLSVAGGLLGLFATLWGVDLIKASIPPGASPRLAEVGVSGQVLAFSLVVSVLTALAFGTLPALLTSRLPVGLVLKEGAPCITPGSRFRGLLVAAEVALAFVLVTGAGLLLKSFARLTSVDPGFQPDRVLALRVTLPEHGYETIGQMSAFVDEVIARMKTVPGVVHAGVVNWLPVGGNWLSGDLEVESPAQFPEGFSVTKTAASAEYFDAMGIPLVRGRAFDDRDREGAERVAIVTKGMAGRIWGSENPIGKRVTLGFGRGGDQPWVTVIGVAGDVKQTSLADESQPAIYFPPAQAPRPFLLRDGLTFAIRTTCDPSRIASELSARVHTVDPNLPIDWVTTMRELLADSVSTPRFRGIVFTSFAVAALALVITGIIGVLSYTVSRRRREIGVRMALGADRVNVLALIVRQAMAMTIAGLVIGVFAALTLTPLLESYLFEVVPADPVMLVAAAVVLILLSIAAAYVPARRAASVDPLVALRSE